MDAIELLPADTRLKVLPCSARAGEHVKLEDAAKAGFARVRIDGTV